MRLRALCREIQRLRPGHFDALHLLGDNGLRYWDKALALRPDQTELMKNYAISLCKFGRKEEALGFYNRALAVRPDYAEVLLNRGAIFHQLKRKRRWQVSQSFCYSRLGTCSALGLLGWRRKKKAAPLNA
jgi:tetratricopeptide (TPR) repeat protein